MGLGVAVDCAHGANSRLRSGIDKTETNVIDIRYFPKQEQQDIDRMIAKLGGTSDSETASDATKSGQKSVDSAGSQ